MIVEHKSGQSFAKPSLGWIEKEQDRHMEIKGKTIGTGKPLLCVPVMESNKEEIIDELRTLAKSEADVVEWRIDVFADYKNYNAVREVFAVAAECMKEKIFLYTFRTKKRGRHGRTNIG